jgi:hypothetical protein
MRIYVHLALLVLFVAACSKNDPVSPVPTGTKVPGVGSSYEFATYETGLDGKKVADSDSTFVSTVIASGVVFGAKTGVWSVESKDAASGEPSDTLHMCLDSKQDVLMYFPDLSADGSPIWIRLPITTGVTSSDSISSTGGTSGFKFKVKSESVSNETISVGASNIATKKIRMTISLDIVVLDKVVPALSQTVYLWFAPSLGLFVQRSSDAVEAGGDVENGEFTKLTKYTLK